MAVNGPASVQAPRPRTGRAPDGGAEPLAPDELRRIGASWRAANYLSVGPIYLFDNPLLREPLQQESFQ
jgi:phosphoketolase